MLQSHYIIFNRLIFITIKHLLNGETKISGFPLDSDSETEDSVLHKISSAFTHMFSSDSEESEEEDSSDEVEGKESIKKDIDGSEKLSTADLESSSSSEEEHDPVFGASPLIPGKSHCIDTKTKLKHIEMAFIGPIS